MNNAGQYYKRKYLHLVQRLVTIGLGHLAQDSNEGVEHGKVLYTGVRTSGRRSKGVEGNVVCGRKSDKGMLQNIQGRWNAESCLGK